MTHNFYVDLADGQLHVHARVPQSVTARPLVCLHPMPNSGAFFADFATSMATDRAVYCPDLPGYGSSFRLSEPPTVQRFAKWIGQLLTHLPNTYDGFDILGFHTGCLVGLELSANGADQLHRLVLPGIPCFTPTKRQEMLSAFSGPPDYLDAPEKLGELWHGRQSHVQAGAPRDRVFQVFVEDLRSAPNGWWGFKAAFEYPAEERLALVKHPVLAIADKGLHDPTLAAADFIPGCEVLDRPDWGAPLFLLHTSSLAQVVREYLAG